MGMSEFYGPGDERESIRTIHRAMELGMNFLDTADIYGLGRNEELVGKAIRDRRGKVRHLGLSEAAPATIRRACSVHPIAAFPAGIAKGERYSEQAMRALNR
jgi:aryl-alcohol dehydrogenase-like predicted oxidoreductase